MNVKDIDYSNRKAYDVFFNHATGIRSFLYISQKPQEVYSDIAFSLETHTREKSSKTKHILKADLIREMQTESRNQCEKNVATCKGADQEIVDSIVHAKTESLFIVHHLEYGSIQGSYTENRQEIGELLDIDISEFAEQIDKMIEDVSYGGIVRIWHAQNANDLCGLMYILHRLKDADCTVIDLELPTKVNLPDGKTKKNCRFWGQLRDEELVGPVSGAKIMTQEKRLYYATEWERLMEENGDYRFYHRRKLISTSYDLVKKVLLRVIPEEDFRLWLLPNELKIIDNVNFRYLNYHVLVLTIFRMIDDGSLELIQDLNEYNFDCLLRVNSHKEIIP